MNSYRLILMTVAIVLVVWAVQVYANTTQLTTYYPAPTGYYDNVTVAQGLKIPCHSNDNNPYPPPGVQDGWIWYYHSSCNP